MDMMFCSTNKIRDVFSTFCEKMWALIIPVWNNKQAWRRSHREKLPEQAAASRDIQKKKVSGIGFAKQTDSIMANEDKCE
jgi:hypothetical protein